MSAPRVEVRGLGKRYRISVGDEGRVGASRWLSSLMLAPLRNLRRLRALTRFGAGDDLAADVIWALRDVSFEVQPGEVLGIIGHNGAGKSTLLKLLSRITEPSVGRALLRGRVGSLLEVGTGFHPEMTGVENIYLSGAILGMRKHEIDRQLDKIIDFSGVEAFIDTPVKRYSSGMYVRLAFAVAAHLRAETLLIDEVLAVGDAAFQRKCLGRMGGVSNEGRTLLFVSHNMAAIQAVCDRVLLLDGGRVAACGEPGAIVKRYMRSVEGGDTQWRCEDPPEDFAYIAALGMIDRHGKPAGSFSMSDDIRVAIELVCRKAVTDMQISLDLLDPYGSHVIVTTPADDDQAPPTEPGRYRFEVGFPAEIWLKGSYGVRANVYSVYAGAGHNSAVVQFDVSEAQTFATKTQGGVDRMGPIALRCDWSRCGIE